MSKEPSELFGRIEGVVILKYQNTAFLVKQMRGHGKKGGKETFLFTCLDAEQKQKKFRMTSHAFLEALIKVVEAEEETECKQLLLIDIDKKEWHCYPIDEQLKKELPIIGDILKVIEKKDYII